jgi:hypothetical protein
MIGCATPSSEGETALERQDALVKFQSGGQSWNRLSQQVQSPDNLLSLVIHAADDGFPQTTLAVCVMMAMIGQNLTRARRFSSKLE